MHTPFPEKNSKRNTISIPGDDKAEQPIDGYYYVGNGIGTDGEYVLLGLRLAESGSHVVLTLSVDAVRDLTSKLQSFVGSKG